jgi:hypothetical protein
MHQGKDGVTLENPGRAASAQPDGLAARKLDGATSDCSGHRCLTERSELRNMACDYGGDASI